MGKRPDQEAKRLRELATQRLGRDGFLELMGGQLKKGFNGSFRVRPSCVDASFVDANNRAFLASSELEVLNEWTEDARLDFPCSAEELVAWVIRAKENFRLPKDFLEAVVASDTTTKDGREMATRLLETLREEEVLAEQETAMEAEPYDGVRGLPPFWDWLPDHVQVQFRKFRDRLLNWGITPEEAACYVKATAEDGVTSFPALAYNGQPVDVSLSEEAVSFLASLWLCKDLPDVKALEQLGLEDAALGHRVRRGSKKDRKDALREMMERVRDELHEAKKGKEPTWRDLLDALRDYFNRRDPSCCIEEIDDENEQILWADRRGREKNTSFNTFRDRLTEIKKNGQ